MTAILDLGSRNGGLGKALSNFASYPFVMDGVQCGGIEGWLQSLKFEGLEEQEMIAVLVGYRAYKVGQVGNDWRDTQTLWWRGKAYPRLSREFHTLIERGYDACFDQNPIFRQSLFETGVDLLTHVIGHHDPTRTTLTEWEYIYNMYRLRARVQQAVVAGEAT
jgi:predicted NAD-dependent protein-ADP-ribosyltransferase YbiA (DUF1768 family)